MKKFSFLNTVLITTLLTVPALVLAGDITTKTFPDRDTLERATSTWSYPFSIAVYPLGVTLDKISFLARMTGNSSFSTLQSSGEDIVSGAGSLWATDPATVASRLKTSVDALEDSGVEFRLRVQTANGTRKACPIVKYRKGKTWEYYDSNEKKWVATPSDAAVIAIQIALKVPLKGLQCK